MLFRPIRVLFLEPRRTVAVREVSQTRTNRLYGRVQLSVYKILHAHVLIAEQVQPLLLIVKALVAVLEKQ